ncbi:MAG: shikimate kinase AroL [Desulfohalobiaceae bacterium]
MAVKCAVKDSSVGRFIREKYQVQEPEARKTYTHGQAREIFKPGQDKIFLIGLRGSGKTTLAKALARELGQDFLDMDQLLQHRMEKSIAEFVQENGWQEFRRQENRLLQEICGQNGLVVATGGGCVLLPENRRLLSEHGTVFYLMADVSLLASRLQADPNQEQRPRFTSSSLEKELAQSLQEREGLYMQCLDYILPADREIQDLVQDAVQMLGLEPGGTLK